MCETFISISCRQAENCWRKEEITFLAHSTKRCKSGIPAREETIPAGSRLIINPTHNENTKKAKHPCIFIAFNTL